MPQPKKPRKKRKPPKTHAVPLRAVPPTEDDADPMPADFDPRTMERTMSDLVREKFGDEIIETVPDSVREAQEVIYDALEDPDPKGRIRLARKALKVSADCADAYVLLAEESANSLEQALDLYEQGVEAGRRAIGEGFQDSVGHFWGLLETRGFMRALGGRAHVRWELGQPDAAIIDALEMLRLNPSDNQGMRYVLVDWLLIVWRNDEAGELLDTPTYLDDASASWAWSRALLAIRRQDDTAGDLIRDASNTNPFVGLYLLGLARVPEEDFDYVSIGDESEAAEYFHRSFPAWAATPGASHFLDKALPGESLAGR